MKKTLGSLWILFLFSLSSPQVIASDDLREEGSVSAVTNPTTAQRFKEKEKEEEEDGDTAGLITQSIRSDMPSFTDEELQLFDPSSTDRPQRRTSRVIQSEVDSHSDYAGFGRMKGTLYEKRTWNQYLLGRNEDDKLVSLQAKGLEVSKSLSTGANLVRLGDMVEERDRYIGELQLKGKHFQEKAKAVIGVYDLKLSHSEKFLKAREEAFEDQKELFREVKKGDERSIKLSVDLIEAQKRRIKAMEEKEGICVKRIMVLIRLLSPSLADVPGSPSLDESLRVLETIIREKFEK